MARLVGNCFKAVMLSMIFIFVFDMAFYVYRAVSLNQRMESVMTSMQKVVMENNYLPEGDYTLYSTIFEQLAESMNHGDTFINGFYINYAHGSYNTLNALVASKYNTSAGTTQNVNVLRTRMDTPADYGDIMVVQVGVEIRQPQWGFVGGSGGQNWQNDRTSNALSGSTTTFWYTYYVPCLKYQSVTR